MRGEGGFAAVCGVRRTLLLHRGSMRGGASGNLAEVPATGREGAPFKIHCLTGPDSPFEINATAGAIRN